MWGNIALETITQVNFGIGFSNSKSDTLIHLSQWQYWWWFWFSFLWSFYYLLVLRVVRFRTLKFRPRLATTYRPRGKWGDLLVCIIPVSWCSNIISNSNLILRMIEWQAESGLFTIRIRGKQWYWVYKFELKTVTDILTAPKNIGRNKWRITTPGDLQSADDYLHILQLRSQNKWIQKYWKKELTKNARLKKFHIVAPQEVLSYNFYSKYQNLLKQSYTQNASVFLKNIKVNSVMNFSSESNFKPLYDNSYVNYITRLNNKRSSWQPLSGFNYDLNGFYELFSNSEGTLQKSRELFLSRKTQSNIKNVLFNILNSNVDNTTKNSYVYNDYLETTRWTKRSYGSTMPLRLVKFPVSTKSDFESSSNLVELFRFRFGDNESTVKHKPTPHSTFLTMKQKRYTRRKMINPRYKYFKDAKGKATKSVKYVGKPLLLDNQIIVENDMSAIKQYNFLKKKKKRHETISVVLSRRMLRTKRTLVLPAHVNLTAITNSYDVIHSWFIPGLGLKMDCIPGRATHHTFYIDNVGFYYGQCAEICGRFHHHMPIRICALPFEHFLIWWHSFGLPKLLFTNNKKNYQTYYGLRKFVW